MDFMCDLEPFSKIRSQINAARSTFYMESFMLFSKSAQLLDYAALLYVRMDSYILIAMCNYELTYS